MSMFFIIFLCKKPLSQGTFEKYRSKIMKNKNLLKELFLHFNFIINFKICQAFL